MTESSRSEWDKLRSAVRSIRQQRGFTQRQLAERLGIWHEWVWRVESGERSLDAIEIYDIAVALGVDVADIYRRAGLSQRGGGPADPAGQS